MREHETNPGTEGRDQGRGRGLSTEQFASINKVQPQSVRIRLCRTGSYYGVKPVKLKNKRLVWPDEQVV